MNNRSGLLSALEAKRKSLGMTHQNFADYIGINATAWSSVLAGRRRLGPGHLELLLKRFAEMATLAFDYQRETGRLKVARRNGKK